MAGRQPSLLSAKIRVLPDQAKVEILESMIATEGNLDDAADRLGVSLRTLYRYIQQLRMYDDIDAALKDYGFEPLRGGPPRKYT